MKKLFMLAALLAVVQVLIIKRTAEIRMYSYIMISAVRFMIRTCTGGRS